MAAAGVQVQESFQVRETPEQAEEVSMLKGLPCRIMAGGGRTRRDVALVLDAFCIMYEQAWPSAGSAWTLREVALVLDAKLRAAVIREAAKLLADLAVAEVDLHSQ